MTGSALARAWLEECGVPPAELGPCLARLEARRAARPLPVRVAAALVEQSAEWLGPALLCARASRGSRLDTAGRHELMHRLQAHGSAVVRAAWLLVLAPLFEALYPENAPAGPEHPLAAELARTDPLPATCDVLVIGSGAGGAPLAWSLAQRGLHVVVVDRGELVIPRSAAETVARHYLHQGMVASVSSGLAIALSARAIGGTTPLNSGTCLRPLPEFLADWPEAVATGLDPWLDLAEAQAGVTVPAERLMSLSGQLFAAGLRRLGREEPHRLPRNAPACVGAGRCCFGCPSGAKRGTDRSFLPEAVAAGARVVGGATVREVVALDRGARAIIESAAGRSTVLARHVVVAAGALETPALLARSRVGHAARRAGSGLRLHPTGKVFAHFPGTSPSASGVPQGLGYRPPELPRVALEGIHTPPSVSAPLLALAGRRMPWWLERHHELATFGLMVCDRGSGSVHTNLGVTWIDYRLGRDDATDLVAGLKLVGQAFFAAGAERVLLPIAGPTCEFESERELRELDPTRVPVGALAAVGFHPQGTARVGRVVGADLRLLDCPAVSVCDASVLPLSPGVNPQLTVMALALRHGEELAERGLSH